MGLEPQFYSTSERHVMIEIWSSETWGVLQRVLRKPSHESSELELKPGVSQTTPRSVQAVVKVDTPYIIYGITKISTAEFRYLSKYSSGDRK